MIKRILILTAILLSMMSIAKGAKIIANGASSQSITIVINDENGDPNTAGITIADLDLYVQIDGAGAESTKIDLVALATADTAWTTGRAFHKGRGLYRIDIPDANLSDGIGATLTYAIVDGGSGSNRTSFYEVQLSPPVDVNAFAGNLLPVTIDKIVSDAVSAGEMGILQITTIDAYSSQTSFTLAGGSATNDAYNNAVIVIEDAGTPANKAVGVITDYVGGATKSVTLAVDPLAGFTFDAADKVYILAGSVVTKNGIQQTSHGLDSLTAAAIGTNAITAAQMGPGSITDTQLTATGTNLTAIPTIGTPVAMDGGSATLSGMLTKMADDNDGGTFDAGDDSLTSIRDRGDSAWTSGSSQAVDTTVASATSAKSITLTAGTPVVSAHRYMILTITDADDNTSIESRVITSWSAGLVAKVDEAFSFTPANGDVATIAQASYFKPIQIP